MVRERNTEMPNLFVIGAMKCGTSSLHYYLDLHPEISMSAEKEPNFFVEDPPPDLAQRVGSRDAYLDLFRSGTRFRGEASHRYAQYPYVTGPASAIAAEVSDAKLIYLVRDPVDRVEAHVRESLSARMGDEKHLPEGFPVEELIGNLDDPGNRFLCPGFYMSQINQYLEHFPVDSILVVDSDRLRSERRQTMADIFGFIGVDEGFWDERMEIERNTAADKKRRSELYVRLSHIGVLKGMIDRMSPTMRRNVIGWARSHLSRQWDLPSLDEGMRRSLRELYRPEVKELRQFTGQDFAGWSV